MKNKEPNYKYESGCAAPAMIFLMILFSACTIIKEKNPSQQENTNIFVWSLIILALIVLAVKLHKWYSTRKFPKKELEPLKRKEN